MFNFIKKIQLERKLAAYVKTLSPEKQVAAKSLQTRLNNAVMPEQKMFALMQEAEAIRIKQMRVAEKLDRYISKHS